MRLADNGADPKAVVSGRLAPSTVVPRSADTLGVASATIAESEGERKINHVQQPLVRHSCATMKPFFFFLNHSFRKGCGCSRVVDGGE